jgi:subtilisin family serine protease
MRTPISIFFVFLSLIFFATIKSSESNAQVITFPSLAERARNESLERLIATADRTGTVRVIAGLHLPFVPEGSLTVGEADKQRMAIKAAQADFLGRSDSFRLTSVKQFDYIPFLAFEADGHALRVIKSDPSVISIQEDEIGDAALAESGPIVGANVAWSSGYTGAGQTVAIIDSGVDKNHTFLSGRVVSEACYSSTVVGQSTSFCPGGVAEKTSGC